MNKLGDPGRVVAAYAGHVLRSTVLVVHMVIVGRGVELDEGTFDLRPADRGQSSTTVISKEGEGRHGQKERRRKRRGGRHISYSSPLLRHSVGLGSSLTIAVQFHGWYPPMSRGRRRQRGRRRRQRERRSG